MTPKNQEQMNFNQIMSTIFIFCSLLIVPIFGYSQSNNETKFNIEAFTIEVTVDSAEELNTVFKEKDLDELFKISKEGEAVTFKLNCSFEEAKNNLKGSMTYTFKGNTNEKEKLLKSINKAKTMALKFYNLKNRK